MISGKGNKSKIKQLGLYQTKKLPHSQRNKKSKMKRHPTKWEKTFAKHTSDRRAISKMYKELI